MQLKTLIIDDEEDARENLRSLIDHFCPTLTVSGMASSLDNALHLLKQDGADVIFLDIHFPGQTGFELLDKIPEPRPALIFTTAHSEYALKAIKAAAVDYLLKPVDIEELKAATLKATEYIAMRSAALGKERLSEKIMFNHRGQQVVKKLKDILYCEADSNYTIFHFEEGEKIVTSKTLKEYEFQLKGNFLRVHSKFLVNLNEIQQFYPSRDIIELKNGANLPVSRRRKAEISNALIELI